MGGKPLYTFRQMLVEHSRLAGHQTFSPDGKPGDKAAAKSGASPATRLQNDRDYVFTHYATTP
jgi:hypothetical protein